MRCSVSEEAHRSLLLGLLSETGVSVFEQQLRVEWHLSPTELRTQRTPGTT